ncbi:MAG: LysO family transporter [Bacillota bacterium]|nr:LysO family transporter [Bacillota bacterium]
MQQILLALGVGALIGRFLRGNKLLQHVSKATLVGVAGLLFVMGAQIGSDPEVLINLPSLGGKAVVFAVLSIVGAVMLSLPLGKGQPL